MRAAIRDYLEIEHPAHMLLVRALPGTGKTTAAAEIVDELALTGRRIAYAGPRHDFFQDVTAKSSQPDGWYEWLPRQADEEGKLQTCRYAAQINTWLNRGYMGMDFCSGVCGWDYINDVCPYYQQKRTLSPVVYVQHQHVTNGHPMKFSVLFGDESPIGAFLHEWDIPAKHIFPPGMPVDEPLTEMLYALSGFALGCERNVEGSELIEHLGGPVAVIHACETFTMPANALAAGTIHLPEEAEKAPYFHLVRLVPLLLREAKAASAKIEYAHRIILSKGKLTLLLRKQVDWDKTAEHVVWLDATGRPDLYRSLFERDVEVVDARPRLYGRIFQVVDRANGKSALSPSEGDRARRKMVGSEQTLHAKQAEQVIRRIIEERGYQAPSVIGFKDFINHLGLDDLSVNTAHFYAARGTNEHQDADAIFVVGAPQANFYDVVKMAKMIYFERDHAFVVKWLSKDQAYNFTGSDGLGRCYPVSGFWEDPDLQAILETLREDEIIQAAHRARPVNHPVDIWLLTNVPIDGLPPDELLTMREIMGSPQGVDMWRWQKVKELMNVLDTITIVDLEKCGISHKTAVEYMNQIAKHPGWELAARKTDSQQGGRPTKLAKRMEVKCSSPLIN
jgi:hypothetical protein